MQNYWILVYVGWGQWEVSHLRWHTQMLLGDTVSSFIASFSLWVWNWRNPRLKLEKALRTIGIHWVSGCLYFEIRVDILRFKMKYSRINTDSWIGSVWIHLICLGWRKLGLKQFTQLFTKFTHIVPLLYAATSPKNSHIFSWKRENVIRYRLSDSIHAACSQWLPATYWEGFWMTWILYWASLSSRSEDFAPMDGGLGRACRGATTSDNAAQNYVSWRLRKRWSSGVLLGSRMWTLECW